MCEEIAKVYGRINEFERDIEHSMDELWTRFENLERKIKKVEEAWRNE